MTFQVHKYCSKCFAFESKKWLKSKDNPDLVWCSRCYSNWYNEKNRERKNTQARFRARLLKNNTRIKKKNKKPTVKQAMATRRHLRMQLRRAEAQLDFLQYLNIPTIPDSPNEIWRSLPGVS